MSYMIQGVSILSLLTVEEENLCFMLRLLKKNIIQGAAGNCPASAGDNLLANPMLKNTEPRNNTGS